MGTVLLMSGIGLIAFAMATEREHRDRAAKAGIIGIVLAGLGSGFMKVDSEIMTSWGARGTYTDFR